MSTLQTGDAVTIDFPGVKGVKRRPAVVVSSSCITNTALT